MFSSLFSKKSDRLGQIWQAQQNQIQQEQAAETQRLMQAEIDQARAGAEAQLAQLREQSEAQLKQAEDIARNAQLAADEATYRASLTPADSEDARQASDRRQRRLQSQRGFASTIVSRGREALGGPSVATQQLLGA